MFNKVFIIVSVIFFSLSSYSGDLENQVKNCYKRGTTLEQASLCADLALAKAIESETKEPVRFLTIYSCTDDFSPKLMKYIINSTGATLRTTLIREFTSGSSSDKAENCANEVLKTKFKIIDHFKTECSCVDSFSPSLEITFLDENYIEVKKETLTYYHKGTSSERMKNCNQDRAQFSYCHIN